MWPLSVIEGTTVLVSSSHLVKKQNGQKKKTKRSEHLSRKGGRQVCEIWRVWDSSGRGGLLGCKTMYFASQGTILKKKDKAAIVWGECGPKGCIRNLSPQVGSSGGVLRTYKRWGLWEDHSWIPMDMLLKGMARPNLSHSVSWWRHDSSQLYMSPLHKWHYQHSLPKMGVPDVGLEVPRPCQSK